MLGADELLVTGSEVTTLRHNGGGSNHPSTSLSPTPLDSTGRLLGTTRARRTSRRACPWMWMPHRRWPCEGSASPGAACPSPCPCILAASLSPFLLLSPSRSHVGFAKQNKLRVEISTKRLVWVCLTSQHGEGACTAPNSLGTKLESGSDHRGLSPDTPGRATTSTPIPPSIAALPTPQPAATFPFDASTRQKSTSAPCRLCASPPAWASGPSVARVRPPDSVGSHGGARHAACVSGLTPPFPHEFRCLGAGSAR